MSLFTWNVHGRYAVGVSEVAGPSYVLNWSTDTAHDGSRLPWATPEYPAMLILGVGCSVTTSATAANRRLKLDLTAFGSALNWLSSGTQAASLTRRWEAAQGYSLETTLAGTTFREPLSFGFILFPGSPGTLTISLDNVQAGDSMGAVTIRGVLLNP